MSSLISVVSSFSKSPSRRSLCLSLMSAAEEATLTFSSAQPRAVVMRRVMLKRRWALCCGRILGAAAMNESMSRDIRL